MYANFDLGWVFLAHRKTASMLTAEIFKARGWVAVANHHDGPWVLSSRIWTPAAIRFWESDPDRWRYVLTVRNHFGALLSAFCSSVPGGWGRPAEGDKIGPTWLEEWFQRHPKAYPWRSRLWRFYWEVHRERGLPCVLRHETLREDLDAFLRMLGERPIAKREWKIKGRTAGKPNDGWRSHYADDGRAWVERVFADELRELRYSYDD